MVTQNHHGSRLVATQAVDVEFSSVLRIRPLKKKEEEDQIVLEVGEGNVARLHPTITRMSSPDGKSRRSVDSGVSLFMKDGEEMEYSFDSVLGTTATQDKVHYSVGLNMARDAFEPLKIANGNMDPQSKIFRNHVLISMGVAETGKTYTVFGSQKATSRKNSHTEDGLVPHVIESFFSQSQHHIRDSRNVSFAVRITMLHVTTDRVQDMLMNDSSGSHAGTTKAGGRSPAVRAMAARFEVGGGRDDNTDVKISQSPDTYDFIVDPTNRICTDVTEAREVVHSGLSRFSNGIIVGLVGKANPRAHTLITLQPVLMKQDRLSRETVVKHCGGTVTILDMAGIEGGKKTRTGSSGLRDTVAANTALTAVMHCLRTIQHNSTVRSLVNNTNDDMSMKKVPYRQQKLTMLLQPYFSPTGRLNQEITASGRHLQQTLDMKTFLTVLITAYPGHRDYAEKKSMLSEVQMLSDAFKMANDNNVADTRSGRAPKKLVSAETGLKKKNRSKDSINVRRQCTPSSNKHSSSILDPISEAPSPVAPIAPPEAEIPLQNLSPIPPPFSPEYKPPTSKVAKKSSNTYSNSEHFVDMRETTQGRENTKTLTPMMASVASTPNIKAPTGELLSPAVSPPTEETNNWLLSQQMKYPKIKSRLSDLSSKEPTRATHGRVSSYETATPLSHVRAIATASPMIRSPWSEIQSPSVDHYEDNYYAGDSVSSKSNSNFKKATPMKTINRVMHASKKKGQRTFHKVEKMITKNIVDRGACFDEENQMNKDGADNAALLKRMEQLEQENNRLRERNQALEDKCGRLKKDKKKLEKSLRDATRRQNPSSADPNWDEEEWRQSRKKCIREQDLIKSPLQHHLQEVEATYGMSHAYLEPTKKQFDLQIPSDWKRADDLERLREKARMEADLGTSSFSSSSSVDERKHNICKDPIAREKRIKLKY